MPQQNLQDRAIWRFGARVAREDSDETGTIVEADGEVEVRWDSGRISYFRRKAAANIRLKEESETWRFPSGSEQTNPSL